MVLSLSTVLRDPELGLTPLTLPEGRDPEIAWAHVSELVDPTPWLTGEELLLTTGLGLFGDGTAIRDYCTRLAQTGVSALGLSTGATLPHHEVPEGLIEAAAGTGIALVHVPEGTPLQRVVRFVSDSMHDAQIEPLRRALLAQRQLSEAITEEDGIAAVLTTMHAHTAIEAAVYDAGFRPLAASGPAAEERFIARRDEIEKRLVTSRRWSMSEEDPDQTTIISPLGTRGRGRGVLVAVKQGSMNYYDRAQVSMVVSLLGVLLELRNSAAVQQRWIGGQALEELLGGELDEVESSVRLAKLGIECDTVQVAVIPRAASEEQIDAIAAQLEPHCRGIVASRRDDEWAVLLCDPDERAVSRFIGLLELSELGPAGIGTVVTPANSRLSLTQAFRARALAERRGDTALSLTEVTGYRAMLLLGDPVERSGFADAVLSPLDAHDQQYGTELVRSLAVYLDHTSNIESAAQELGIHRHTMRSRLRRVADLTGRSFTESGDVLELWLACELRALG
ncbi:MAG: PucR family transcriptional regulator ligand-binding domain-containing protein [Leucobacter sp.]